LVLLGEVDVAASRMKEMWFSILFYNTTVPPTDATGGGEANIH
jgi:hypothetical protein